MRITRDGLAEIGWLDDVPNAERERLERTVGAGTDDPRVLARFSFDMECILDFGLDDSAEINSYAKIVRLYAQNSDGEFNPQNVMDRYLTVEGSIALSFDLEGNGFGQKIPYDGDWFQKEAHVLINGALKYVGRTKRFEAIPLVDRRLYIVHLTPSILRRAVNEGLIEIERPADDDN